MLRNTFDTSAPPKMPSPWRESENTVEILNFTVFELSLIGLPVDQRNKPNEKFEKCICAE